MEKKKTKQEIVKLLINKKYTQKDDEELLNLLIDEPISIDIDKEEENKMTKGDKIADKISEIAGSWGFIITFIIFLLSWILLNYTGVIKLDKYPFILLNLLLSCLAALQAPIIMMSQNRQAKKDSLRSKNDYRIDLKSEILTEQLHKEIQTIIKNQKEILKKLEEKEE